MNTFSATAALPTSTQGWHEDMPVAIGYPRAWDTFKAGAHRVGELVSRWVRAPSANTVSWSLPSHSTSVPRARRLTRARLASWDLEGLGDVAELLVSELVTNALCHAQGAIRLTLSFEDGLLRCEVEDAGTAVPEVRDVRVYDEGGRGLHLLEMLSCCWGTTRTHAGKVVWFELQVAATTLD
jgi:hypothetical protein